MAESAFTYAIQVDTGTNEWKSLYIRSGQFPDVAQNQATIDVTAHGDASLPWRSFALGLYEALTWNVQVMAGGSAENQAAFAFIKSRLGDADGVKIRVRNTAGAGTTLFQGTFLVTGMTLTAPLEDVVSYTIALQLTGAPTTDLGD